MRAIATIGVIGVAIVGLNLFGGQLNSLFVRYPGIDKALHVLGYLSVYLAIYWVLLRTRCKDRPALWAAGITLILSLVDESIQGLGSSRSVEAFDVVANVAAVALGWAIVRGRLDATGGAIASAAIGAGLFVSWSTHAQLIDYSRALRYEQQLDFVQAREHFRRALENGLRTPALYNELAWVEVESGVGNPQQAVEYAAEAIRLQPDNPDILDTYGWALLHAGRTAEALEMLGRAYAANPDMYCVNYHLGAAYLKNGEPDVAERYFRKQIEMSGTREAAFAQQALNTMTGHR